MSRRRAYENAGIRVYWDSSRCIHTGRCLQALPRVFDVRRRPWVEIDAAPPDAIADAVERCPTGALRYDRLDGGTQERPPRPSLIVPIADGPLLMVGDLDVRGPEGDTIARETRLTLCRCGMTRNQPFCDNTHLRRGWRSGPSFEPKSDLPPAEPDASDGPTVVIARQNASLELRGHLRLYHSDGELMAETGRTVLCRCGNSRNKPFCDGSHEAAGFHSRAPGAARDRLEAETPAAFTPNPRVPDPQKLPD